MFMAQTRTKPIQSNAISGYADADNDADTDGSGNSAETSLKVST
jgi:hypothetical protein